MKIRIETLLGFKFEGRDYDQLDFWQYEDDRGYHIETDNPNYWFQQFIINPLITKIEMKK